MKKILKSFSLLSIALSIIFFIYGSIKLARLEKKIPSQTVKIDVPEIQIVQPDDKLPTTILTFSTLVFFLGILGIVISYRFPPKIPKSGSTSTQIDAPEIPKSGSTSTQVDASEITKDHNTSTHADTSQKLTDGSTSTQVDASEITKNDPISTQVDASEIPKDHNTST